jgi:hypothetical protein
MLVTLIRTKRLEPRGRIIPHPIKINNGNQGPTKRDPQGNNLHQQDPLWLDKLA